MNLELRDLFDADQNDRRTAPSPDIIERDRQRRARTLQIIAAEKDLTAEDCLHAAFIFQHGDESEDYWRSHELAKRAVSLGHPEERKARWLTAASYDRWLTSQGKPQKYGTQFWGDQNGWRLLDYDPATTDEERAEWGVPPIAEALRRVEELNRRGPFIPSR